MKFKSALLLLSLLSLTQLLFAQINDKPRQVGSETKITLSCKPNFEKPIWVVFSYGKIILTPDTLNGVQKTSVKYIKSINVLKDIISIKKYGKAAQNGVIEIHLDDKKYPNVYAQIQNDSIKIRLK